MQRIDVPSARNPAGHTQIEILAGLRRSGGSAYLTFRYELLDSQNRRLRDLDGVQACTISQDWLADIKRRATFTIRDLGQIDYLSDRIKPYVRLHLPPYGPSDWVEWPQGVFLLSSPTRASSPSGMVSRAVQAWDLLQAVSDERMPARYTVAAGTKVTDAVSTLLSGYQRNVTASVSTLSTAREWEPGTTKLKIINELLGSIAYDSLSFDEDGIAIVRPYVLPALRSPEYTYADDADGLIVPNAEQTLDLFSVPNRWVIAVTDPDKPSIRAVYTNTDPSSPTSTVRRGRTITDFRTAQDAPDTVSLNAQVQRLAFEASQVFEAIDFQTALMPIHSGNDSYRIKYSPLAINAQYVEQSWDMELRAGATMRHRARRVVQV